MENELARTIGLSDAMLSNGVADILLVCLSVIVYQVYLLWFWMSLSCLMRVLMWVFPILILDWWHIGRRFSIVLAPPLSWAMRSGHFLQMRS